MARLVAVDYDPFASQSAQPRLTPVDYDPFAPTLNANASGSAGAVNKKAEAIWGGSFDDWKKRKEADDAEQARMVAESEAGNVGSRRAQEFQRKVAALNKEGDLTGDYSADSLRPGRALESGMEQGREQIGAGLQFAGETPLALADFFGRIRPKGETEQDRSNPVTEAGKDIRGAAVARQQEIAPLMIDRPDSLLSMQGAKYIAQSALQSAPTTGTGLAAAVINPAAGLSLMGAGAGSAKFADARAEDKNYWLSAEAGAAAAAAEVVPEMLPLGFLSGRLLKHLPGTAMKRMASSPAGRGALLALSEGASEGVTELSNIAYEIAREGKSYSDDQIEKRLIDATAVGTVMGGGMAAVAEATGQSARAYDQSKIADLELENSLRAAIKPRITTARILGPDATPDAAAGAQIADDAFRAAGVGTVAAADMAEQDALSRDLDAATRDQLGSEAEIDRLLTGGINGETQRPVQAQAQPSNGRTVLDGQDAGRAGAAIPGISGSLPAGVRASYPGDSAESGSSVGFVGDGGIGSRDAPAPQQFTELANGTIFVPGDPVQLRQRAADAGFDVRGLAETRNGVTGVRFGTGARDQIIGLFGGADPASAVEQSQPSAPPEAAAVIAPPALDAKRTYGDTVFDERAHDLLDFIALNGGLDRTALESEGIDPANWNSRAAKGKNDRFFGKPLFRKSGGMSLETLREKARDAGFRTDKDVLDLIGDSLGGRKTFTPAGSEYQTALADVARQEADAQARQQRVNALPPSVPETDADAYIASRETEFDAPADRDGTDIADIESTLASVSDTSPQQRASTQSLGGDYTAKLLQYKKDRRAWGLNPQQEQEYQDLLELDRETGKVGGRPMVGVRNKTAYVDALDAGELLPVQGFTDADDFKTLNDKLGHAAGDDAIREIGDALVAEFGEGNVFHRSGDEFLFQGTDQADVDAKMQRVRDRLSQITLRATDASGNVQEQRGIGLSYGTGTDEASADAALVADKQRRKESGQRVGQRRTSDHRGVGEESAGEGIRSGEGRGDSAAEGVGDARRDPSGSVPSGTESAPRVPPRNWLTGQRTADQGDADTGNGQGVGGKARPSVQSIRAAISAALGPKFLARLDNQRWFQIVDTVADLPPDVRKSITGGGIAGFVLGNRVFVVAEDAAGNPVGVLLHELGVHYGMTGILGEDFAPTLAKFKRLRAKDDRVGRAYERATEAADKDKNGDLTEAAKATLDEEALAYFVERNWNEPDTRGIVAKVIDAIKRLLNRLGMPLSMVNASPELLREVAIGAARMAADGRITVGEDGKIKVVAKYSRKRAKFEPWKGSIEAGTVLYHGSPGDLDPTRDAPLYLSDRKSDAGAYAAGLIPGTGKGQKGKPQIIKFIVSDDARVLDANIRINDAVMEMTEETADEAIDGAIAQAKREGYDFVWFEHPSIDGDEMNALIAVDWRNMLLEDEGDFQRDYSTKAKYSRKAGGGSEVAESDKLVALHNVSPEGLLFADKIGGLAVPSIGITKAATPFTGFGSVTLIGSRDLATPSGDNPVFSADAFTQRFPDVEWPAVPQKKASDLLASLDSDYRRRDTGEVFDALVNKPDRDEAIRLAEKSVGFMRAWIEQNGESAPDVMEVKKPRESWMGTDTWTGAVDAMRDRGVDVRNIRPEDAEWAELSKVAVQAIKEDARTGSDGNSEVEKYIVKLTMDRLPGGILQYATADRAISFALGRNNAPTIDRYGTRKSMEDMIGDRMPQFSAWVASKIAPLFGEPSIRVGRKKVPMTLENVVEAMTAGNVAGKEKTLTFGTGKAKAMNAKQYRTLEEIQADRAKIVAPEVEKDAIAHTDKLLDEYRTEALLSFGETNWQGRIDTWAGLDAATKALADAAKKAATPSNVRVALVRNGFRNPSPDAVRLGVESLIALRETVTDYFEAKPQRAVKLSEFAGAVVKASEADQVRPVLEKHGVEVREYSGEDAERRVAIDEFTKELEAKRGSIRFSRKTPAEARAESAQKQADLGAQLVVSPGQSFVYTDKFTDDWRGQTRKMRERIQDKLLSVRDAQRDIEQIRGAIEDAANVYRRENLMHGRVGDQRDKLQDTHVKPLIEAMAEAKVSPALLEDYLEARHAKERNEKIAATKGGMPDGAAGMTTAQAEDFLQGRAAGHRSGVTLDPAMTRQVSRLARKVYAVTAETRRRLLDSGQITQEAFDALENAYAAYVPLRGKDGTEGGKARGTGKGIDVRGKPVLRAAGRGEGNRAQNILAEVIADAERSIINAEKLRVGRTLARLVLENPNPDVWAIEPVKTELKVSEGTPEEIYEAVKNLDQEEGTIIVKVKGKPYRIVIEDQRMADALKNMAVETVPEVIQYVAALNRYFSAVLTRYNPSFVGVNMTRDLLFGMTGIWAEHGTAAAAKAAASYFPAMRAAWRDIQGKPPVNAMGRYAREFAEAGGKTYFGKLENVSDMSQRIGEEFKTFRQMAMPKFLGGEMSPVRALAKVARDSKMVQAIEAVNDTVENTLRLSVYAARREAGASIEQAAEYAKSISVNFNRRGSATSWLNALYLFFNAATQGAHRTLTLLKNPKVQGVLGGLAALQATSAMFLMGLDDEDGEPLWDSISPWDKQRNLILAIPIKRENGWGATVIKIPMPYGFNLFPYMGGRSVELARDLQEKPVGRAIADYTVDAVVGVAQAMSPIPFDDGWKAALPHWIRIFTVLSENKDDLGIPIRAGDQYDSFDKPRSASGRDDTPLPFKVAATALNRLGGGDDYTPPYAKFALDWAPEDLAYLFKTFAGGLGSNVVKSGALTEKLIAGVPVNFKDVPVLSSFVSNVDQRQATSTRYYDHKDDIEREVARQRDLAKETGEVGDNPMGIKIARNKSGSKIKRGEGYELEGASGSLFDTYKQAEKDISRIRDEMRAAFNDQSISYTERIRKIDELKSEREEVQRELNAAWREQRKKRTQ